eukprot:scaffold195579_cov32-Tisochrysis_lutea.AAC.1
MRAKVGPLTLPEGDELGPRRELSKASGKSGAMHRELGLNVKLDAYASPLSSVRSLRSSERCGGRAIVHRRHSRVKGSCSSHMLSSLVLDVVRILARSWSLERWLLVSQLFLRLQHTAGISEQIAGEQRARAAVVSKRATVFRDHPRTGSHAVASAAILMDRAEVDEYAMISTLRD